MKRKKAFTLIELMVVILILAILAALIVPNVFSRIASSKKAKAQSDLSELCGAINQFQIDCGRYPTAQEGFDALRHQPNGAVGWHGPYLQKDVPLDPWNNQYTYQTPGGDGQTGYLVESKGDPNDTSGAGLIEDGTDVQQPAPQ